MRVSLEWLNEYVDLDGLSPQAIADALTQAGLEVEHIETTGPRFSGVVLGRVQQVEPHPNADRLRLVTVELGRSEISGDDAATQTLSQAKVVCGAPNVREGILIAFAREGATVLNRKDGSLFTLAKTAIRGVESAGMICAIEELGLEADFPKPEDGIWPMDDIPAIRKHAAPPLGMDLKAVLGLEGDTVLHVAPPANRGDLMSMRGVAREVAALFDRPLQHAEALHFTDLAERSELHVVLKDPDVCRYYGGAMMRKLAIGPSPAWMSRRLQAAGVRSINNVVDITNYVMLETGQPLHAFDQLKLGLSGAVDVRRAREGETLLTLDDVSRTLTPEAVVVTMNDAPIALAGLMGGQSTEIDEKSQRLFLESAHFPAVAIRRSAKSVGLRSEASARFERGTDIENCRYALLRAAELLQRYAGAEFIRLLEASAPGVPTPGGQPAPKITLYLAHLEQALGLAIDEETTARILKKLGFLLQPATRQNGSLLVSVPSFRQEDILREIDLIEEVARIYGYDKIPYTLPKKTGVALLTPRARFVRQLGETLRAQGLQEVMTPSLIGPRLLEKTGFSLHAEQTVAVVNSHSAEHTLMRQSLAPGLLEVAQFNQAQGEEDVWIYELGRVYFRRGKANHRNTGLAERLRLAGLLTGTISTGRWRENPATDFYCMKGILENLLTALHLEGRVSFAPTGSAACLHPGKAAALMLDDGKTELGFAGELHPERQATLKFRQPVYLFELDAELLFKALGNGSDIGSASGAARFHRLPLYPAIRRDMALLAPVTLPHGEIVARLEALREPLLREIELFDEYRAAQLGTDKRSLAYRLTFRSDEATLTESDVDQRLTRLKESLAKQLPVQFR